jgi:hypothetical protein
MKNPGWGSNQPGPRHKERSAQRPEGRSAHKHARTLRPRLSIANGGPSTSHNRVKDRT